MGNNPFVFVLLYPGPKKDENRPQWDRLSIYLHQSKRAKRAGLIYVVETCPKAWRTQHDTAPKSVHQECARQHGATQMLNNDWSRLAIYGRPQSPMWCPMPLVGGCIRILLVLPCQQEGAASFSSRQQAAGCGVSDFAKGRTNQAVFPPPGDSQHSLSRDEAFQLWGSSGLRRGSTVVVTESPCESAASHHFSVIFNYAMFYCQVLRADCNVTRLGSFGSTVQRIVGAQVSEECLVPPTLHKAQFVEMVFAAATNSLCGP